MPSEGSQTQEITYYMISFIKIHKRQHDSDKKWISVCQGKRWEEVTDCKGVGGNFLGDRNVQYNNCSDT